MFFNDDHSVIETAIGGGLCPLGYAAKIDDLVVSLMQTFPSAVLLDIRLNARSRWYPSWNRSALQAKWGMRYIHEKRLGNVNYQYPDRPIQLLDPEAALPWVTWQLQQNVVLLLVCACRDYDQCHRKVVTEYIITRCQDIKRVSGMHFDVERNCYVGLCCRLDFERNFYVDLSDVAFFHSVLDKQVVVSPQVFEESRLLVGPAVLYEVQYWVAVAYQHPDLAMFEVVS